MSRRRSQAANEAARREQPTRRLLLGSAAAPLIGAPQALAATDPAAEACKTWLARHAEHERLGKRWQAIESRLFKEHNWPRLTRAQRKRFPEKHEMDELYDRMDALHAENQALLTALPSIAATTYDGLRSKLQIAALEVCPEDYPEAHALIKSILNDLAALHGC